MPRVVRHKFTFANAERAKHFCLRVHLMLADVATYRDGCEVFVLDAGEEPRTDPLVRLARVSSGEISVVR